MGVIVDHTGEQFGKLKAIRRIETPKAQKTKYLCECECGNTVTVTGSNLVTGTSTHCGCSSKNHGYAKKERLYNIWVGMRQRCNDVNAPDYKRYGAKGVCVSAAWENYLEFRNWALENGYSDDLSIDRIDVNGNYEPSNCRWTTNLQQQNNKSNNRNLTYRGVTKTTAEWARVTGISPVTLNSRLMRGWTIERILNTPVMKRGVEN